MAETDPRKSERLLVLGAGELGSTVIKNLAAHEAVKLGHTTIIVLLRPSTVANPSSPKSKLLDTLRRLDVRTIASDIAAASVAELADVFASFDTIISCTGFIVGPGTQIKIAEAVLAASVQRYFPWQFGVDYDIIGKGGAMELFDEQLEVRAMLRN